jgi:ribosome-binding factor A
VAKDLKRAPRVAERMREEIASVVGTELGDPRVRGVIISRVELTDDLAFARVFFRLLEGGILTDAVAKARRKDAQEGLDRAAGLLRREVVDRLAMRHAPELRFAYDEGVDASQRVEELLYDIKHNR